MITGHRLKQWGVSSDPPPFPKWSVAPLVSHNINTLNILVLYYVLKTFCGTSRVTLPEWVATAKVYSPLALKQA